MATLRRTASSTPTERANEPRQHDGNYSLRQTTSRYREYVRSQIEDEFTSGHIDAQMQWNSALDRHDRPQLTGGKYVMDHITFAERYENENE